MTDTYRSIESRFRFEPEKTKGSRHIATLCPVETEVEVDANIARLRDEFPNANHHAYAWRIGTGTPRFYYSDDGEPSGSAGRPILQYLEGRDVTNILAVVSRIFGGTKLGVGGLVRAYGGAAAAALDAVEIVTVVPKAVLRLRFPYECSNAVQAVLHPRTVRQLDADYGAAVAMDIEVLAAEADEIRRELRDATGNRLDVAGDESDEP